LQTDYIISFLSTGIILPVTGVLYAIINDSIIVKKHSPGEKKFRGFLIYKVMNVCIQGIKGAFHEEAAIKHFGHGIGIVPQLTFPNVVSAVNKGEADLGIIAVENTISGTIHTNLNLIRQSDLNIVGEEYLRIKQNLVALPGTTIDQLEQVGSHYMAINQCRLFFNQHPHIKLIETDDTAHIMQEIAKKQIKTMGGIGSRLAADCYGLEILAKGIETNKRNYTRFLIIQKGKPKDKDINKSSLSLTLQNKKGSLSQVLSIIAFYDIDLSKIESLPILGEPWHYRFYIDLLFNDINQYKSMLLAITPLIDQLEILGEYKSGIESLNQIHTQA
jgi:prephenate dehydratase